MPGVSEKSDKFTQEVDAAREALAGNKHKWIKEFTAPETGTIVRAMLQQRPEVKNPGAVNVVIVGGNLGENQALATVTIAGLEAKKGIIPIKINQADMQIVNAPKKPNTNEGQVRVLNTIITNPEKIALKPVAAELYGMVGELLINDEMRKVFQKQLAEGKQPVQIKTFGLALTERNTFEVSITS